MATLFPDTMPRLTPRAALATAAGAGVLSAALILWVIGDTAVATGFLAAAIVLGGALVAWRALAPEPPAPGPAVDWQLVRTLAQESDDAIAVTDRAGRLVCGSSMPKSRDGRSISTCCARASGRIC